MRTIAFSLSIIVAVSTNTSQASPAPVSLIVTLRRFEVCAKTVYAVQRTPSPEKIEQAVWSECRKHFEAGRDLINQAFPDIEKRKEAQSDWYLSIAKMAIKASYGNL